jgi:pantoate--beta-alanine ligase
MEDLGVEPEYLALVHPSSLAPVDAIDGETLVAVAARVGEVHLIDNTTIRS